MLKGVLVCFLVGSIAGLYAFTGSTPSPMAETVFVLGFIAGLALLRFGARGGQRRPGARTEVTLGRKRA